MNRLGDHHGQQNELPQLLEIAILRIFQEALEHEFMGR